MFSYLSDQEVQVPFQKQLENTEFSYFVQNDHHVYSVAGIILSFQNSNSLASDKV